MTLNRSNSPLEHVEQVTFLNEFRKRYPSIFIFGIPNGGKRDPITAKRLKLEGQEPGVPDMYVPAWNLWIEMKRQRGSTLSQDQRRVISHLEDIGDTVIIAFGWQNGLERVQKFLDSKQKKLT